MHSATTGFYTLTHSHSNVLSLRVRSLHSLPESWQPGTFPFTFALAIPLPSATPTIDDNPSPRGITVPQGVLKLSPDKDPTAVSAFWKWPNSHVITSKASQVPECEIKPRPLEDETGELNTKQVQVLLEAVCGITITNSCSFT